MADCKEVFQTRGPVVIYPASGTGAWEAALVNTLSPGDRVVAFETGEFARLWAELARRIGLEVDVIDTDWTEGVDPALVEGVLQADRDHAIRAILVVHNETSTGATSRLSDDPQGDRCRRASRAAAGRRGVVARHRSRSGTTNGDSTSPSPDRRKG